MPELGYPSPVFSRANGISNSSRTNLWRKQKNSVLHPGEPIVLYSTEDGSDKHEPFPEYWLVRINVR
jgi:hypothetical protein